MDLDPFEECLENHKASLLALPNVVGVAIGYKETGGRLTAETALVVLVTRKVGREELPELAVVPARIGGLVTDVVEIGEVQARRD